MNIKLHLLTLFTVVSAIAFSQGAVTTTVGTKSTLKMRRHTEYLGTTENHIIVKNHYATFSVWEDEIELVDKKTMEVTKRLNLDDVTEIIEAEAMLVGENIIVVNETGLLKGENREVSYFVLSASTLEVREEPKVILKCETVCDEHLSSTIATISSEDHSLGAIRFRYEYISGSVKYGFHVFDDAGPAYQAEASFNPKNYEKLYGMELLTNEGELVISGWNGYYYTLYTTEGESDFKEAEIRVEGKEVVNFMVNKNKNEEFIITGYYRKEETEGMTGVFQTKMDLLTGLPESIETTPFSQNMCAQLAHPTYVEKRLKEVNKGEEIEQPTLYRLRGSEMMDDGTLLLFSERVSGSTTYQQILVTAFDQDHNVIWNTVIKKYQYVAELGGMAASFGTYKDGNDFYVIFGDNSSNYDENMKHDGTPAKARFPGGSHVLVLAKIDTKNGGLTLSDPMYKRDVGMYLMPRYNGSSQEDKQFYFLVSDFKKGKYASLNFQ